ncbi:MAG: hypothetical protein M3Y08_01825 [Fibrobacterota bacterium]|nr:hypothetical protein [Fibrobacterota bacterium]
MMDRKLLFPTAFGGIAGVPAAENWAPIAIGGGRLFFCLVAGILIAFAFQWILTSLFLATGLPALGGSKGKPDKAWNRYREDESGSESKTRKIGAGLGLWAMITTGLALFCASWLAAELMRFGTRAEAVILGLVIWAGYMMAMMWIEAAALGSLLGEVMAVFKHGLKLAVGPLKAVVRPASGAADRGADAIAEKVREEFREREAGQGLTDRLRDYIGKINGQGQDRFEIEQEANGLFNDEEIKAMARRGELQKVDRNRFRELIVSRGDISAEESGQWAEALQSRWNSLRDESQPVESPTSPGKASQSESGSGFSQVTAPTAQATGGSSGFNRQGVDAKHGKPLTEGSLAHSGEAAKTEGTLAVAPGFKERLQVFKDFLRTSDRRELNPVRLEQEVEMLVVHPEEGYEKIEKSVQSMKREEVVKVLRLRMDISSQEAESIADLVDSARTRMLSRSEIREHRMQESTDKALERLRDRVYSLKRPERDYGDFRRDVSAMLEDPRTGLDIHQDVLKGTDRESLFKLFYAKEGISKQDAERMADLAHETLVKAGDRAQMMEAETRKRVEEARIAAQADAEGARTLSASAAWWLFGISVVTGVASVLGGYLGSRT